MPPETPPIATESGDDVEALRRRCRDVELLAFDLDNTLYDEGRYFEAAFDRIVPFLAERSGRPQEAIGRRLREILRAHGKHYHYLFSDILGEIGLDPTGGLPDVLALFRSVRQPLAPFPGVTELLRDLSSRYRMGLITSGMREVQENKLRLLGLAPFFEEIIFSSTLPENKPGQMPFRFLLEKLGVDAARAIYVGDNPLFDFRGPNQLGMLTFRVPNDELDDLDVVTEDDAQVRIQGVQELRGLFLAPTMG